MSIPALNRLHDELLIIIVRIHDLLFVLKNHSVIYESTPFKEIDLFAMGGFYVSSFQKNSLSIVTTTLTDEFSHIRK